MTHGLSTPVWQLTAGELIELVAKHMQQQLPIHKNEQTSIGDDVVYQYAGIAKLLNCSKTMVSKHRKAGWIEPAIRQRGRKIVCDAKLALELFGEQKTTKRKASAPKL